MPPPTKTYEWGFSSDIEQEFAPKGLNEDTVRFISAKKNEPEWMLDWRLKAYRLWLTMEAPDWAKLNVPPIDYQDAYYYAEPKAKPKLGIARRGRSRDPARLRKARHPDRGAEGARRRRGRAQGRGRCGVRQRLGRDHLPRGARSARASSSARSARRSANIPIWSANGSARSCRSTTIISPRSTARSSPTAPSSTSPRACAARWSCSTYFRINAENTGQFERTLIVADKGATSRYLEGCTAPMRDENQLHAAVVELVALDDAEIKYSTVQNWYPGDAERQGRHLQFRHQARAVPGQEQQGVSWTQVETGSAITWKYPSCVLAGENSVGEFYSVAVTNNRQQADTGTKMIHLGKGSRSTIVSKGISAGRIGQHLSRAGARRRRPRRTCATSPSATACCSATNAARTPCPISRCATRRAQIEHEATTSRSATTSCSTRCSAGSIRRRRWR